MSSIRLEKARENFSETEKGRIAKLMSHPYLEEELAGVYERGVRLSVERLAKNSKVPKTILFANAALGKELRKQSDLLELAKHHRLVVISWNQRQFFLRQIFDSQSNFRFARRNISDGLNISCCKNEDQGLSDNFSEIFDSLVSEMTKAMQPPVQSAKESRRALSVTICEKPTLSAIKRRHVSSAPPRPGRETQSCGRRACSGRRSLASNPGDLIHQQPPWYSCLVTKLWMQPHAPQGQKKRKRVKSAVSIQSSHRPSTVARRCSSADNGLLSLYHDEQADVGTRFSDDPGGVKVCDSMRKWASVRNRSAIKRILPTLPEKALQKMMDLFGEDIDQQKRYLHTLSKAQGNRNILKDKRWKNLEALLKSLQNN